MENVNQKELFRIINRAVSRCFSMADSTIDTEIKLYREKYNHRKKNFPQLDIFADDMPTQKEVTEAVSFCERLEDFRQSTNPYTKGEDISEHTRRELYFGLQKYRPHMMEENKGNFEIIEKRLKYNLPEFRPQMILNQYIEQAQLIIKLKKEHDKQKKKEQSKKKYEDLSYNFFQEIINDDELKNIKASPQKIELYKYCIEAVDCLPSEKYKRTSKYKLKSQLYSAISEMGRKLGPKYKELTEKAHSEYLRFEQAIDFAKMFAGKEKFRQRYTPDFGFDVYR